MTDIVNEYVLAEHARGSSHGTIQPMLFADGSMLSVQASNAHYSSPKDTVGPWWSFEVGPADHRIFPELRGHRENDDRYGIHGWVPLAVLLAIVERKGPPQ